MYAELERITCPRCKVAKEKKEFGKDSTQAKGISCWCKPCKKQWRSEHRKKDPEAARKRDFAGDLKKHYGMTVAEYERLYEMQKGCCACCGVHSSKFKRGLHVDHHHESGQIRGLLCTQCNPGLGYFEDSIEKLQKAIRYLKKFKK
jgi:hypothetical protein